MALYSLWSDEVERDLLNIFLEPHKDQSLSNTVESPMIHRIFTRRQIVNTLPISQTRTNLLSANTIHHLYTFQQKQLVVTGESIVSNSEQYLASNRIFHAARDVPCANTVERKNCFIRTTHSAFVKTYHCAVGTLLYNGILLMHWSGSIINLPTIYNSDLIFLFSDFQKS